MGKVYVLLKILPKEVDVDLDEMIKDISKALPKEVTIGSTAKEPIAFGLNALKMAIVMPEDFLDETTTTEKSIEELPSVSQVEVEYVTRV